MGGTTKITNTEQRLDSLLVQTSSQGAVVSVVLGTNRIAGNLLYYSDFKAIAHTSVQKYGGGFLSDIFGGGTVIRTTTYTYTANLIIGLCEGQVGLITRFWRGKQSWAAPVGPNAASLTLFTGSLAQPVWTPLLTYNGGADAYHYNGWAILCAEAYDLGASNVIEALTFEIVGPLAGLDLPSGNPDANPANIIEQCLTNPLWSVGLPSTVLGPISAYRSYCRAAGLWLSPAYADQAPTQDRLAELCRLTNSEIVVADEQIHIVPLGDEALSANGATYTPDLTPIYDLTLDHFKAGERGKPVRVTRNSAIDAYNTVTVQYRNRAANYNAAIAVAPDAASVELYGERPAPKVVVDSICDGDVASRVAHLQLKRYQGMRNKYEFRLPGHFCLLLPTNIVTLTEPSEGLDRTPVRIERIEEDESDIVVTAWDFPASVASTPLYPIQPSAGYVANYNADPGDTVLVHAFEPPSELAGATGLEVWLAVKGAQPLWGGCHVWISLDGTQYTGVATVYGASTSGELAGPIASNSVALTNVTGTLLSASAADAGQGLTLCYVGGANPEFIAYSGALLTGAGAYTLSGLVQGLYGTLPASHVAGNPFVRCDRALGRSGALPASMVGRTLSIKLTSFNIWQHAEQDLADVTAHTYTVTGRLAGLSVSPGNLAAPGSFEAYALGSTPGTWSAGTVQEIVDVLLPGFSRALYITGETVFLGARAEASPGQTFRVAGRQLTTYPATLSRMGVRFYDVTGAVIATEWPAQNAATFGWRSMTGVAVAPAGSASAALVADVDPGPDIWCLMTDVYWSRLITTVESAPYMATQVFAAEATDQEITLAIETLPGQLVCSVTFDSPVAADVVITATAIGRLISGSSAFDINFGAIGDMLIFKGAGADPANATSYVGSQYWRNAPGAGVSSNFSRAIAATTTVSPGTWTIAFLAKKSSVPVYFFLEQVALRVELIKL